MTYLHDLDLSRLPKHVGIVMDGNGRWAKQRGLPRTEGHIEGERALFDVVEGALDIGLEWLTVYAFSTENWRRPPAEVTYLMYFNRDVLHRRRDDLDRRGTRIRFAGPRGLAAPPVGRARDGDRRGADEAQPPDDPHDRVELRRVAPRSWTR